MLLYICLLFVFCRILQPPSYTLTDTLVPVTSLFRSRCRAREGGARSPHVLLCTLRLLRSVPRALPSLATLIERCPKQFRCVVKRGRPQETDIRSLRSLLMSRHRSRTAATHIHTQGIAMPDTCNIIASPFGALNLIASDTGLRAVLWETASPTRVTGEAQ